MGVLWVAKNACFINTIVQRTFGAVAAERWCTQKHYLLGHTQKLIRKRNNERGPSIESVEFPVQYARRKEKREFTSDTKEA